MRSIKGLRICWFLCLHNSFHNHAEAVWSFFQIASVDQQKALESCCYKIISNTTSKFISTAAAAAAAAKSLQSCPTLCNPIDGSPPGSPIPGILQARILEWVAISFSNAWKWKAKAKLLSRVRLLATPWTTAYQAPPSMGFSRQEWVTIAFSSPIS